MIRSLILSLLMIAGVPAEAEVRQALVMVVWKYDSDSNFIPLPGIEKDAAAISAKLESLGFNVTVVRNPTLGESKRAVDDFGAKLRANRGTSLFYFSGHGCENDGKNYLIPLGAVIKTKGDLDDEALSAQRILTRMEEAGTNANLVFLDCCRNAFTKGNGDLAPMRAIGTFIGFATASAKSANASADGSPYTMALVKHMGTPGLSVLDMHTRVTKDVMASSSGEDIQNPFQYSGMRDDFYFLPPDIKTPATPPQSPESPVGSPNSGVANELAQLREQLARMSAERAPLNRESTDNALKEQIAMLSKQLEEIKNQSNMASTSPTSPSVSTSFKADAPQAAESDSIRSQISSFIRDWWSHNSSNDPSDWASDFSAVSDYCYYEGSGKATRDFVEEDRRKLVERYPRRSYDLIGDPSFRLKDDGTLALNLSYSYRYSGVKSASGSVDVSLTLQRGATRWFIIEYNETVRRR
jgi:hypothetical protein